MERAVGGFTHAAAVLVAGAMVVCCSSSPAPSKGSGAVTSGGSGSDPGAGSGGTDAGTPGPPGGGDWMQYRHDPSGASVNEATWEPATSASLSERWTLSNQLGTPGAFYSYAQPMMAGTTLFFTTAFGSNVVALDARTATVEWTRHLDGSIDPGCSSSGSSTTVRHLGIWAAAAVANDTVYAPGPDGKLYALNATDGSVLWSVQIADPTPAGRGQFIESSPAISLARKTMYLGIASSEGCAEVAGRLYSIDLTTHATRFVDLVPSGQYTAPMWSSASIDEAAGAIFITTGAGKQAVNLADVPLAQAFVRLDATDLHVVDHWQNPTSLIDSDFGASPTLFSVGGTNYVAAPSKDGTLYVLNRDALSAGPVWTYRLARIDPSDPTHGGDPTSGWGSISTPTFANGVLFAAGGNTPDGAHAGSVVAFDAPATNHVKWVHDTPGYVISAMPAAGGILVVASNRPDNLQSWLEVLDQQTGAVLRSFGPVDGGTYGAPVVARGMIVWSPATGAAKAYAVPGYATP